ncbi:hypothetical protein AB1Y20_014449 [Prymnesium parvum]|uniref:mRNA 5'-phosphatase n=1 Tax=Prymnesium parvum TaxID=97485 RepID=A0AB34IH29_PRYPA
MTDEFSHDDRTCLLQWFSQYAANDRFEIEARFRDVTELGFNHVLSTLSRASTWSNAPAPVDTIDLMHVSGVRETYDAAGGSHFLRKAQHLCRDVMTSERVVRFAVASEEPAAKDSSPVRMFRFKQRVTFEHKGTFKFELTRVRQGDSEAAARAAELWHEIEIEYCGQKRSTATQPAYLVDSFLMKVSDVLRLLKNPAPIAKRPRLAPGELQEGTPVTLQPGTEVKLLPSGYGTLPFEGEMPAELSAQTRWVFSHKEPATGHAFIMNLPVSLFGKAYPLYYFFGRVPASAVEAKTNAAS